MNTPTPRSCGGCILRGILGSIIAILLVHGIITLVFACMVSSRINAIKAKGDPVTMSDLAGPSIPDSENGGVIYQSVLTNLDKHRKADKREWEKSCVAQNRNPYAEHYEEPALDTISPKRTNMAKPGIWDAAKVYTAPLDDLLPQLDQAAAKPRCRYKTKWEDGTGMLLPHLKCLRDMTRTLAVRAALDARNGDMNGAVRCLTAAFKLSNSLKDEPNNISVLTRCAVRAISSNDLQRVADYGHIDKTNARKLYDLYSSNDIHEHAIRAMKGERALTIWVYDAIPKLGWKFLGISVRDMWVNMLLGNDNADQLFDKIVGSYAWRPFLYADELHALRMMNEEVDLQRQSYRGMEKSELWERHNGEMYALPSYAQVSICLLPVYSGLSAKSDDYSARLYGDQIFLALLAYKDSFGVYPDNLNEARAKLGWKLQQDPFTGKDFIYRRDGRGFILYSIGPNFTDDKGLGRSDNYGVQGSNYDDITWRMDH